MGGEATIDLIEVATYMYTWQRMERVTGGVTLGSRNGSGSRAE